MSGPGSFVDPRNNAFAGGSRTPASNPVGVGGAFTSPSAAGGPPPSFGTPATAFARNDRGSNIRIPYARVVALHGKDKLLVDDPALTGTGRMEAYEYDGLEAGELAWIMTKQFKLNLAADGNNPEDVTHVIASSLDFTAFASNIDRLDGADFTRSFLNAGPDGALIAQSAAFSGYGPDRMQRLAYTKWMEALFKQRLGRQSINMRKVQIAAGAGAVAQKALDSEIEYYGTSTGPLTGASLFCVPDLAYGMQVFPPGNVGVGPSDALQVVAPMMQGLFLMEQGPFLRSYGVDHDPVTIHNVSTEARAGRGARAQVEVDRHLGSSLAQSALLVELKRRGILNWVPDGITLSKFETGPDGMADAEFDARTGQLFNVGVQGPCITKTWCNDPEMAVLPMDKVFMLVVADVSYATSGQNGTASKNHVDACRRTTEALSTQTQGAATADITAVKNAADAVKKSVSAQVEASDALAKAAPVVMRVNTTFNAYKAALYAADKELTNVAATPQTKKAAIAVAQTELEAYKNILSPERRAAVGSEDFKTHAEQLRNGSRSVTEATMTNFRLMRATSSFLANRSHFGGGKPGNEKSRCGLKVGYNVVNTQGVAEFIVGGWCIGTVMDSAASRALGHNGIRTAPATMAININVNVEWWSADKLFQHYQDVDRGIYDVRGGGGLDNQDIVQKPESTTLMRTQDGSKSLSDFGAELGSRSILDADTPEVQRLASVKGQNDYEGSDKRPDPNGVNTDVRRVKKTTRGSATAGNDPRIWATAPAVAQVAAAAGAGAAAAAAPTVNARGGGAPGRGGSARGRGVGLL